MVDVQKNETPIKKAETGFINRNDGFETLNYGLSKYALILFGVGFLLNVIALYFSVSQAQDNGFAGKIIAFFLIVNALIIGFFVYRLFKVFKSLQFFKKNKGQGSILHLRYVRFFVMAAAIPAIIIALFSGVTYGRGVQVWLSGQVKDAITSTSNLGNEIINQISESARADIMAMASDLNQASANFSSSPEQFKEYLQTQAVRRAFVAVYIIRENGEIISKAERPQNVPAYKPPSKDNFDTARVGDVSFTFDEVTTQTLFRLDGISGAYLYAIRLQNPEQISVLSKAEKTISSYRALEARQANIQFIFGIAYLEIVLLVVLAAAWLGLYSATTISVPVAKLVNAAGQVAAGDLSVRIDTDRKVHELALLTDTFNTMTKELRVQKDELEAEREEAVKRSQFINAVIEGVSPGVLTLSKDGIILTANSSAAKFLAIPAENLIGTSLEAAFPQFIAVIEKSKTHPGEKSQIEISRENINLQFEASAAHAGDDLVITFDDVSALIQGQRQAAWRDVARRIAHEIKNPLTPIQLSAERLTRKFGKQIVEDKDTFVRLNETIIRQVSDIGRMVDEFSSFARMPAPKFIAADICEITREAVFSQKITFANIDYQLISPPEKIKVMMDERMISQALLNILKNAAESISHEQVTQNGEYKGKIDISVEIKGENVVITILDNGIGFPANNRHSLLEPYVTTREKGTGLGLPIVVRIIEEHGGKLRLIDRPDGEKGAGVQMNLPILATSEVNSEDDNG
ncbi:sensor histidine kinase [Pseudaquidulcibacter saccharophilus]|uniref:sensor histidine kinase n=1 Tax=Pseudaquidulcibacter saccharophilus TaxID=2831900 RepID=UPI001EFEFD84|nr:PAS domain-containing sensor histidine kinase [Pseudaquidulcibacter saccharophilus]